MLLRTFLALILLVLLFPNSSPALDRCNEYIPDVRSNHILYFGAKSPWWYGVGQLRQESNCRADITAFDAGQGIAQFMPATANEIRRQMGDLTLDTYNPEHATKMQAFYMSRLHKQNESGRLWLTYQAYNGGWGNLNHEYERAGVWEWGAMKSECKRKKIQLKNGSILDFCEVNYDYSVKINNYGKQYRGSNTDQMRFW